MIDIEYENARLTARLRTIAEALRELSPGPHPGPMNAEDYVPLIAARVVGLERFAKSGSYWPGVQVWLAPVDPAEVVAELREREFAAMRRHVKTQDDYHRGEESAFEEAADLVAKKLGVE